MTGTTNHIPRALLADLTVGARSRSVTPPVS